MPNYKNMFKIIKQLIILVVAAVPSRQQTSSMHTPEGFTMNFKNLLGQANYAVVLWFISN